MDKEQSRKIPYIAAGEKPSYFSADVGMCWRFVDVWLFTYDEDVSLKNATTDEVEQTIWLDRNGIMRLKQENKLVDTLDYFFEMVDI